MGFHMVAHGGVRIPILRKFAGETATDFAAIRLIGLPMFPAWFVYPFSLAVPPVEFLTGVLLILGFKTRLASIVGGVVILVLIFALLAGANFADRHSVDRISL